MKSKRTDQRKAEVQVRERESEPANCKCLLDLSVLTLSLSRFSTFLLPGMVAALLLATFVSGRAEIPEPDNVIYGTIALDGAVVTAARTDVVVEARPSLNEPAIASYRMGDNPQAGNFYSLRLKLESFTPLFDPTASQVGNVLLIVVRDATGVRAQANYTVGQRGEFQRLDFGSAVPDSDGDGLPDAWEAQHFGSLGQGPGFIGANGLSALQNFIAGTNPNDANSVFELSIAATNNLSLVSFIALRAEGPGYEGLIRFYSMEASSNMAPASWVGVSGFTNIVGNNQTVTYQSLAAGAPGFFRARVTLQ